MNALALHKLPVGIQSFEDLRQNNYLYVDKTALVYRLVTQGKSYFLSRPRRFGKSLLISTFEAYFLGKKELFNDLAIEKLETEWKKHPVLHIDLNAEKYDKPELLESIICRHLNIWEESFGKNDLEKTISDRFAGIIRRAKEKTGEKVVVLVDEYDKPLLQTIGNKELNAEYRKTFKSFFGVLKSSDAMLRFVFFTGVTKFAQVSIFSDLNQLVDISMYQEYTALCGISKHELIDDFQPDLQNLAQKNQLTVDETIERITKQYDGYHFCEFTDGVYNPFSVLSVFASCQFRDFWFKTGTPTFLVELLTQSNFDLRTIIDGVELNASAFDEYRVESSNPIPVLYQSGYLTIKNYDPEFKIYTLGFPNDEVRYGFLNFIVPFYTPVQDQDSGFYIGKFVQELRAGDVDSFMNRMKAFYADIPYDLNDKTERHYHVIFYIVFKLMGQFCEAEIKSAKGRADAVVKTGDYVYVFEFKLNGTAEEAMQQIENKGYLIPYTTENRKLVKVGASFSKEERNIDRWLFC